MEKRDQLEVVAKTVDEAIEIALKELDVDRDEVEIEVLSRGRPGFLGFGSDPAKIKATLLPEGARPKPQSRPRHAESDDEEAVVGTETISLAQSITNDMLRLMQANARVYLQERGAGEDSPALEIEGEDSGLLIGRRGETLQAFEYLLNYLVSRKLQQRVRVPIDVEGYKERRYRALRQLANRTAERVASSGRAVTLNPMSPAERRVVHMALANHNKVVTQSNGEGAGRKVTISPKGRG